MLILKVVALKKVWVFKVSQLLEIHNHSQLLQKNPKMLKI